MNDDPRVARGRLGEQAAGAFLRTLGHRVLASNFRVHGGEIDLVARDGKTLVFVEVKTQQSSAWIDPQERVTGSKRRRLIHAARAYVRTHRLGESPCRFDIVTVILSDRDAAPKVEHIKDAFAPKDW